MWRQRGEELPVGVVLTAARARRVTQPGCLSLDSLGGGLRPRLLRGAAGGACGAAIRPRGKGRGLPTGPGTCEAPCRCRPRHDKKSGAGRCMPGPGHVDGRCSRLPGPCRALPAFANHDWSWRGDDGGDVLGGRRAGGGGPPGRRSRAAALWAPGRPAAAAGQARTPARGRQRASGGHGRRRGPPRQRREPERARPRTISTRWTSSATAAATPGRAGRRRRMTRTRRGRRRRCRGCVRRQGAHALVLLLVPGGGLPPVADLAGEPVDGAGAGALDAAASLAPGADRAAPGRA